MVAFTVCSNNYLGEAISLGNSITEKTNLPVKFVIFLSDKFASQIKYNDSGFQILEINDEICSNYSDLIGKYNIVELSTAVKPGIFKYLMARFEGNIFYYFDPDIYFFNDIKLINDELEHSDVLLTPHVTKPVNEETEPFENTFLNYGIYNLGFIGLIKNTNTLNLLNWWEARTTKYGIIAPENGLFVDQLWINFVPVYFENVKVSKHTGLNIAYWNINERSMTKADGIYTVNCEYPLVFFHFSSFDFSLKELSKRDYTHPAHGNEVLQEILSIYKKDLQKNNYTFYKQFKPMYDLTYDSFLKRHFYTDRKSTMIKIAERLHNVIPKFMSDRIVRLGFILSKIQDIKRHRTAK